MMRLFSAFAILPFAAAALAFVGFPVFEISARAQLGGIPANANDSALAFAAGMFIVALFVTVLGALPVVSIMLKRGPISLRQSLLVGVVFGNAPFVFAAIAILIVRALAGTPSNLGASWYGASGALRTIVTGTLMGSALASVFWVVGLRGREVADS